MAGHPNLEAILISVQIFHLTISHSDMGHLVLKVVDRHLIGCENDIVKLFLLLVVV